MTELGWARPLLRPFEGEEPAAALDDFNDMPGNGPRAALDDFGDDPLRYGLDDFGDVPAPLPAEERPQLDIVTLDDFVAIEEPGAEALVGDPDDALFPANGDAMVYGDGGAGKTTLMIDLGCHLAAGDDWLRMPVPGAVRVLLIENEGPRPHFRKKLERKRDGWQGSPLEDRLLLLQRPWGKLSLKDPGWREALAEAIESNEIDVLIAGPVTRLGMDDAGTLQEVRDFLGLVDEVRERSRRHVAVVLIHHENKGGKVSGAWEGSGDTLLHVTGTGHGLRLYVQKARWSSSHHATTLQLRWTEGEGFAVDEAPELDDVTLGDQIVDAIRSEPGTGWRGVEEATRGVSNDRRKRVRDELLREGVIVNVAKAESGERVRLDHCPPRKAASLYPADDPTIRNLPPGSGADGGQMEFQGSEP